MGATNQITNDGTYKVGISNNEVRDGREKENQENMIHEVIFIKRGNITNCYLLDKGVIGSGAQGSLIIGYEILPTDDKSSESGHEKISYHDRVCSRPLVVKIGNKSLTKEQLKNNAEVLIFNNQYVNHGTITTVTTINEHSETKSTNTYFITNLIKGRPA